MIIERWYTFESSFTSFPKARWTAIRFSLCVGKFDGYEWCVIIVWSWLSVISAILPQCDFLDEKHYVQDHILMKTHIDDIKFDSKIIQTGSQINDKLNRYQNSQSSKWNEKIHNKKLSMDICLFEPATRKWNKYQRIHQYYQDWGRSLLSFGEELEFLVVGVGGVVESLWLELERLSLCWCWCWCCCSSRDCHLLVVYSKRFSDY